MKFIDLIKTITSKKLILPDLSHHSLRIRWPELILDFANYQWIIGQMFGWKIHFFNNFDIHS